MLQSTASNGVAKTSVPVIAYSTLPLTFSVRSFYVLDYRSEKGAMCFDSRASRDPGNRSATMKILSGRMRLVS